jgi:D-serine deaminase-like pyridoxal phosphate-dependent protein
MNKFDLQTPAILVDLDRLEHNIKKYQALCNKNNKQLWPMVKTHKSIEIVKMQQEAGAAGFLCGTLDECEAICNAGIQNIMYAYPVASNASIKRIVELSKKCNFFIRLDNLEGAKKINALAGSAKTKINYTIIIDSGLNRFGVQPDNVVPFAKSLQGLKSLVFKGISTHPGHVYSATKPEDIPKYVTDEKIAIKKAVIALKAAGYKLELITSGATPTFTGSLTDENINVLHPGNYVFNDNFQLSTKIAQATECALSVFTTIISNPCQERFICDAGAKCLGLDQGAHGNTSIKGYGYIKEHPEITISSLSEEVGKLHIEGNSKLKVGDRIEIIPNHACSAANLTSYLIGCRGNRVEKTIQINMRGNSTKKGCDF